MISKKKQELIDSIIALVPENKAEESYSKRNKKEVIYKLSKDSTKMMLSCRKCGNVSELESTSEVICPHCQNTEKQQYVTSRYGYDGETDYEGYELSNTSLMTTERYIFNIVGVHEGNLFIMQQEAIVEKYFLTEDIVSSTFSLTVFDEEGRPTFFQNSDGEWTNKQPTRQWYSTNSSEKVFLNDAAEEKYYDNPVIKEFRNGYYHRYECSREFQSYINTCYKSMIGYGKIKAPEKKKTKNKEIISKPELEELPAAVLASTLIDKFVVLESKTEGMISKVHCPICGNDSIHPANEYISKCPNCNAINMDPKKYYSSSKTKRFVVIDEVEEGILLSCVKLTASIDDDTKKDVIYKANYEHSLYITDERVIVFDTNGEETLISKVSSDFSSALSYDTNAAEAIVNNTSLTIEQVMKHGILKYSGLYEFITNISDFDTVEEFALIKMWFKNINYHCLYEKSHVIELFSKCGMSTFVSDLCKKVTYPAFINKKATTIQAALGVDNNHFTQIRENNLSLLQTERFLNILKIDNLVNYEDVEQYLGHYSYDSFIEYLEIEIPYFGTSIKKRLHYLNSLDEYQCIGWNQAIGIWIDYINMCRKLKCDLSDRDVVCTNSLKLEHDRAVKKFNALKDKEVAENFNEAVNKYKEYEFSHEDYDFFVKIPDSQEELYEEGRKLNHCVGSYVDRITKGDAIILFIRRNSEPDKPLATAEIRGVQMYQCRAKYNSSPMGIPNMRNFLKEWAKDKGISMKRLNMGY